MKNRILIVVVVFLCFSGITLYSGQDNPYEALIGAWDVETEDGQYTFVFEFSVEDGTLKGLFTGSSGETDMDGLKFEENELTFSVDLSGMVIDFSATIEGDKLEGMLSLEYGEANIIGTKRK